MAEFNLATVVEAVALTVPDRPAIISRGQRLTFAGFAERSARLAAFLSRQGFGCYAERQDLSGHQAGQHLMAQYLRNGPEYLEGMIGAARARVAPFNVNYQYVAEELAYLLRDARPAVIQFHAEFAPLLAEVLGSHSDDVLLLQVADNSGNQLLPGATGYEEALASSQPIIGVEPDPDDLYVLYTGGTTGMPKGVLWRQADIAVTACGLICRAHNREWHSIGEIVAALRPHQHRIMPCAPLIHGASQWAALQALMEGNAVVFPDVTRRFDPAAVWDAVAREAVGQLTIVGDAFALSLVEELERHPRDVSSLRYLVSGGAPFQPSYKDRFLTAVPGLRIVETMGSSETGVQGRSETAGSESAKRRVFIPGPGTVVISEDRTRRLLPGESETGWLAAQGRVPLGYLGDQARTEATFPVVGGDRLSVPGDRARLLPGNLVELLGRDSVTINSGGEKIFAEEVEAVIKAYPDVLDAVVCGRPSERWGSEVTAIVASRSDLDLDSLRRWCGGHLARYKVPKAIIRVDQVVRSPAGKPDYRWAVGVARNSAESSQDGAPT